jgi:integrase
MPKIAKMLSATEVRRLTEPGLYPVGCADGGLLLQVTGTGAKSWILRYSTGNERTTTGGKKYVHRRDLGLGGYPGVTLEHARERARAARDLIRQGIDPVAARSTNRDTLRAASAKGITFDECARKYIASKSKEFANKKHIEQWRSTIENYASPVIGKLPVETIELAHIVKVLEPIWESKTETASRLRGRIESVLAWATVSGFRHGDNPARWRGNLSVALPAPNKIAKVRHYAALPWQTVPDFMVELRKQNGISARAFEFAILTAARSGEVRGATWSEIDFNMKVWTVPAVRMKAGKAHRVPLSDAAVNLLNALPRFDGVPHVFASPRGGQLSDVILSKITRTMGVDAVPHGFRSSFKDWCRSSTSYADEVSELALAHVNSDQTRAAYARDELLPKRALLMRDWAKFLSLPKAKGDVVAIRGAK